MSTVFLFFFETITNHSPSFGVLSLNDHRGTKDFELEIGSISATLFAIERKREHRKTENEEKDKERK